MQRSYQDVHFTEDPDRGQVWSAIAAYLGGFMPEDAAVLELGAGHCEWINQVRARERVALDSWEGIRRHAAPGVECVIGDAREALQRLGQRRFDRVLASNFFEHLDHDALGGLLDTVWDRLRDGGLLLAIQPNFRYAYRHYFDDYTHRSIFSDVSLQALLRARGFAIVHAEPRFLPLTMKSRLPKWRWLVRAYLASPVRPLACQMLIVARKERSEEICGTTRPSPSFYQRITRRIPSARA